MFWSNKKIRTQGDYKDRHRKPRGKENLAMAFG